MIAIPEEWIHPNIINNHLKALYNNVYCNDIADFEYDHYDLIIFGDVIEHMPSFPGGYTALAKFLEDNIKYPQSPETEGVQGRVVCQFNVGKDGTISDIKVGKSIHPLLDAEAVRVISIMPKWIPGEQLGVPVNVRYSLPITFRLDNDNDSTETNSK